MLTMTDNFDDLEKVIRTDEEKFAGAVLGKLNELIEKVRTNDLSDVVLSEAFKAHITNQGIKLLGAYISADEFLRKNYKISMGYLGRLRIEEVAGDLKKAELAIEKLIEEKNKPQTPEPPKPQVTPAVESKPAVQEPPPTSDYVSQIMAKYLHR